jgi:hypothetical protein
MGYIKNPQSWQLLVVRFEVSQGRASGELCLTIIWTEPILMTR